MKSYDSIVVFKKRVGTNYIALNKRAMRKECKYFLYVLNDKVNISNE